MNPRNLKSLNSQVIFYQSKEMPFGIYGRRGLLVLALIFVLIPLWGTFEPLFEFILFAISLAALTYQFLSSHLDGYEEISSKISTESVIRVICRTLYFNFGSFHTFTNSSAFNGGNKFSSGIWKHGSSLLH